MSQSQPDVPGPKSAKKQREEIISKLTSQHCVKKGNNEDCTPRGGSRKDSAAAENLDIRMKLAGSAEILQNMRRDSGAGGESQTSTVKYSKGESITDGVDEKENDTVLKIRPDLKDKFRPGLVNQIIESTIKEHLSDKEYLASEAQSWTKAITEAIQRKTKEQNFSRYKLVACVVLGERRGQGLSSAYRCLWDSEADCAASYTFMNDSLYCIEKSSIHKNSTISKKRLCLQTRKATFSVQPGR
ncbi:unnamed protein product [Allacma fusca]|uniref:Tctex1 domain-containing protein 2 n=1 Tax=Allacma fusca TaxID=39272 RepID=A0A8J2LX38_9HEXA|nr:unnamed protein product [Allacma fusca]